MTNPEGQTARDQFPEDAGIPEIADDTPEAALAEDPQFAPDMGRETAGASVDFGTTAEEQAEGEPLDGRLAREEPDVDVDPGTRPAEDPDGPVTQLDQDVDTDPRDDSGTDSVGDDVLATGEASVGGEGPEERAVHPTAD
ncbi:hypothetical protein [Klenkia taihuensis]|uniref:DUF5709 domain-containing protein n=1 Tax=Klenkia taihuensis TaxID=1225127 RepID=A0A1I1QVR4_9ACTN|nr:hypothetical protein [Klenkia taihuensis]GHE07774.1 hypothetical protein GCM10011381_05580 [Klenkia taihuensis]SFD22130.1 hypothetical protein SAMN05661030_2812 [Klenkia taihuensis]